MKKNTLRLASSALVSSLTLSAAPFGAMATQNSTLLVTNANDDGAGSFRNAIEQANANPALTRILFRAGVSTVALQQPVEFSGDQNLKIDGNGATLNGASAGGPAFRKTGAGDLAVCRLTVRDAPEEGIAVQVPSGATGVMRVSLIKVDIIGNKGHGVLVNDQEDDSAPDDEQPPAAGSAASLDVSVFQSRFLRNGYSVSDRDGLRVNEGGDGDLIITVKNSVARDNAADGIEVDERGEGNVKVEMKGSRITGNGRFDPADLDDGFDIDEYDAGSILGSVVASLANGNYEEGFDFNENNEGDLRVDMRNVEASGNGEEGIDYEEDDDFDGGGNLVTRMTDIKADRNGVADDGDAGVKIREKGEGNLDASLTRVKASDNLIGGINIREDDDGNLKSSIKAATTRRNVEIGINFDERDAGDLDVKLAKSVSLDNVELDLQAEQEPTGAATFLLSNVIYGTIGGNVAPTILP